MSAGSVFAHAARSYELGELAYSHAALGLALTLQYTCIPGMRGEDVSEGSQLHARKMHFLRRMESKRGLIIGIAKHIPCQCFDQRKIEAKRMQKIYCCFGCKIQFPDEDLLLCNRCKDIRYCSKECQTNDWERHKPICDRKKGLRGYVLSLVMPSHQCTVDFSFLASQRATWITNDCLSYVKQ